MTYTSTCPECKNEITFEREALNEGDVVECETCGITLEVTTVRDDGNFDSVIVEEEK